MDTDEELMKKAEKRAKDKIGFYVHFACYVLVNVSLFILYWSILEPDTNIIPIIFGPLFGWGIGIVAHFIAVFMAPTGKAVQKEYEKLKNFKK